MADEFKNSACYGAAQAAAKAIGADLSDRDLAAAFRAAREEKERLRARGATDNFDDRIASAAERIAEQTRIAAALQRRHAALNVIARDRLDQTIEAFKKAGLSPRNSILAIMEGTSQGIEGGRVSVYARRQAYEVSYVGQMLAEIQKERPHLVHALADKRLSDDVFHEMGELREGGNPGVTGNADAKYLADVFSKYAEFSRQELNRKGASIGKLDGWAGAQVHDDIKMIQAGKEAWVEAVGSKLDLNRTFPDLASVKDVHAALGDIYDTIITGVPARQTPREKGQRVNPANLAKSLGKTRVLHFKDAASALAYRDEFGYGNSIYGVISHQRRAASMAAQMDVFGPNPEIMFGSLVEAERRKIRDDASLSPKEKNKKSEELNSTAGPLRAAFDVMSGMISRPVNVTAAKIGSDIRAVESMAKLGAATFTAMPTDVVSAASASMFRGGGFFNGMVQQIDGVFRGRPKGEQAEISYLLGEGFDGMIGEVVSRGFANDGAMGAASSLMEKFFKWNGLTAWTDIGRSVAGRTIAAEMGMRSKTAFDALPANYSHVLGMHGIGEAEWNATRQAALKHSNGNSYITPDAMRDLPDEVIEPLVRDKLASAKTDERKAEIMDEGRRELELQVASFVADEVNYGIVETDAASRRITALGTRPGTFAGEAVRFIMQFKGFPVAFAQRVLGRALFGGRGATKWERLANNLPHIGALMGGLTVAGYMAMVMKDAVKGYWPPRDPTDPKVMVAALTQGGALGIYGDFLFGQASRFNTGPVETLSGPTIGSAGELWKIYTDARDGNPRAADYLNFALNNSPYANLFYVRPALDYLFLNSLKNWMTPGYSARIEKSRMKQYGQRNAINRNALQPFQ
jgi:hypothetical protein